MPKLLETDNVHGQISEHIWNQMEAIFSIYKLFKSRTTSWERYHLEISHWKCLKIFVVSIRGHCIESYWPGRYLCMLQYSRGLNFCTLQNLSYMENWNARSCLPELNNLRPTSLCNITNTRDSVSFGYPNTKKIAQTSTWLIINEFEKIPVLMFHNLPVIPCM